jgi:hypothetical protein
MEETKEKCECPECEKRKKRDIEHEEMTLAILLAIVPLTVLTLFGQVGLF